MKKNGRGRDISLAAKLAGYIRGQILTGVYVAGQQLPIAKDIAKQFGVDPNTARAAYRRLSDDGLVESTRGKGTFVTATAGEKDVARLRELMDEILEEADKADISPDDLATIIWVHGRFRRSAPKLWHVDDWHPYMDAFRQQLQSSTGLPVDACTVEELADHLSSATGPSDGDVVYVTKFNMKRVQEKIDNKRVHFFAIEPHMAPATIKKLKALPKKTRLGVVCIEPQFAKISGKVMEKSGVTLSQKQANTTDIATLPELYGKIDVATISTVALGRLEAAKIRLPDIPIVPFSYEIPDKNLVAASAFAADVGNASPASA